MLSLDISAASAEEIGRLIYGLVVPRPIAWISTISSDGQANLAPHSFFNAVSCHPPILTFASTHPARGGPKARKDTLVNVLSTKEFVVNFVSRDLLAPMVTTGREVGPETDEFELAGLEKKASAAVRPPRVALAKAALECRLHSTAEIGDATVVYGEVVHVHLSEEMLTDGRPDARLLQPVSRLGGALYGCLGDIVEMKRN
jgi:flavin reductase (DIM6/NTAB) family NADH-FMN oxidoreductase RutF